MLAADAVMVGDSHLDVFAAADVGIPCMGVLWGGTAPRAELEEAGAAVIAETIPELERILSRDVPAHLGVRLAAERFLGVTQAVG